MPIMPYCLNVHPGETLESVREAIATRAATVKRAVAPDRPYPLGLRLSAVAAAELATQDRVLEEFADFLRQGGFEVSGVNGFPYGAFHAHTVKAAVYEPDWSTPERLKYTGRLATVLSALLPEGGCGNISTVPLAYKSRDLEAGARKAAVHARQIALLAEFLDTLRKEEGREIVLALEPEPDCVLDNIDDTAAWFEEQLLYEGARWLSAGKRSSREEAEALLRRHVGVCLDTCHFAVVFEDPLTALSRLESSGIRVARVQLSAALRCTVSDEALLRLRAFIDPVYLHQTRVRLPLGRFAAWPDLDAATLAAAQSHQGCELRTHFHMPLYYDGDGTLESTNTVLDAEFFAHVVARDYPIEIETYTFDVLPTGMRTDNVEESIIREHRWAQERCLADQGVSASSSVSHSP
ncbi:MAG: metabolite traffic protein EboE [Kiritimatiellae bacterium]|nr:metabolite traffic protein EboE [Kiritimatiellia bacterium]